MNDDTNDAERRKKQQQAFQKIVEAGHVPPVLPQKKYELSENDRKFLRSLKISPE
jgi:hypothetical protein